LHQIHRVIHKNFINPLKEIFFFKSVFYMSSLAKIHRHGNLSKTLESFNSFGYHCFGMSKVALIALTRIQQSIFDTDPRNDLVIQVVCPGFCRTDINLNRRILPPEVGAETAVFAALFYIWLRNKKCVFLNKDFCENSF
jgi:NAD(P)-dependent dehydrogenase (short-subunit alcohol dehydrogenase family)